jgi:hypothetical protein
MTGADIEREVRKQQAERARRGGGPSTALLEADIWFNIVQHHPDMSARAIVTAYSDAIEALTGIASQSKQRALVSAAKEGLRVHLGGWGGFGNEADVQFAQAKAEAQDEHAAHKANLSQSGKAGGGAGRTDETKLAQILRDRIVVDNACGSNAKERLDSANAALIDAGFNTVSIRTLHSIVKKSRDRAF